MCLCVLIALKGHSFKHLFTSFTDPDLRPDIDGAMRKYVFGAYAHNNDPDQHAHSCYSITAFAVQLVIGYRRFYQHIIGKSDQNVQFRLLFS